MNIFSSFAAFAVLAFVIYRLFFKPTVAIPANAFLVDVRSPSEFSSGSATGAVNIPLPDLEKSLDKFRNKEHIVVFCRTGMRSRQAQNTLKAKGIQNVINGGSWQSVNKAINQS